jgi:hypothetical protein
VRNYSLVLAKPDAFVWLATPKSASPGDPAVGIDAALAELVVELRIRIRRAQNHDCKPIPHEKAHERDKRDRFE